MARAVWRPWLRATCEQPAATYGFTVLKRLHLRKVAIAKHIGLQALRLANSIILPMNTTHYSLELQSYLQK